MLIEVYTEELIEKFTKEYSICVYYFRLTRKTITQMELFVSDLRFVLLLSKTEKSLWSIVKSITITNFRGGIEPGESKEEALMRETLEETGLKIIPDSIKEYGYVLRKQKGKTEDVFIQENYYYFSQVEKKIESQSLEGYEALEKFVLEFVNHAEAIKTNRNINHVPKNQIMIERDAKLLELLMEEKLI